MLRVPCIQIDQFLSWDDHAGSFLRPIKVLGPLSSTRRRLHSQLSGRSLEPTPLPKRQRQRSHSLAMKSDARASLWLHSKAIMRLRLRYYMQPECTVQDNFMNLIKLACIMVN